MRTGATERRIETLWGLEFRVEGGASTEDTLFLRELSIVLRQLQLMGLPWHRRSTETARYLNTRRTVTSS